MTRLKIIWRRVKLGNNILKKGKWHTNYLIIILIVKLIFFFFKIKKKNKPYLT